MRDNSINGETSSYGKQQYLFAGSAQQRRHRHINVAHRRVSCSGSIGAIWQATHNITNNIANNLLTISRQHRITAVYACNHNHGRPRYLLRILSRMCYLAHRVTA